MNSIINDRVCNKHGCINTPIHRGKYCEDHRIIKKLCNEPNCKNGARRQSDKCITHGGGKRCNEVGCMKHAYDGSNYCYSHGGGKRCIEPNCTKLTCGKTNKCIEHGGGKRCIEPNCIRAALSGAINKCKAHGGGKRCIESGCTKSAKGSESYCIAHGGGKRCDEIGCTKSAKSYSTKCKDHGGGKRCIEPNCTSLIVAKSNYCTSHGGGKRCSMIGCKKAAKHTDKCIAHGGGRRCTEPNCTKSAQHMTDKCGAHGGGKRCPNCVNWIDSRCGTIRFDWYCATCFKRLFPEDPRSKVINCHTKEIRVRNAIAERFSGFIHDTPLYTGNCECTHRRRIDHRKLIGNTILAIETDEFSHQGYDKADEEIRYHDLYMIHSGKWVYIRFNPDSTRNNKTDLDDRIVILLDEIEKQIERIEREENSELVEIIKLFY